MTAYAEGVLPPTPGQILREQERREDRAIKRTQDLIEKLLDAAEPIWRWGDGEGGYVMVMIQDAVKARRNG